MLVPRVDLRLVFGFGMALRRVRSALLLRAPPPVMHRPALRAKLQRGDDECCHPMLFVALYSFSRYGIFTLEAAASTEIFGL